MAGVRECNPRQRPPRADEAVRAPRLAALRPPRIAHEEDPPLDSNRSAEMITPHHDLKCQPQPITFGAHAPELPAVTHPQPIEVGASHFNRGRFAEAEIVCRQILVSDPNHPDALHLLGLVAYQVGQHGVAVELLKRAITLRPGVASYYSNLGIVLRARGDLDASVSACRAALQLDPQYSEAHYNLGNSLKAKGDLDAAIAEFRTATRVKPDYFEAYNNLGVTLMDRGQLESAIAELRAALGFKPDYVDAHNNLGVALIKCGQWEAAIVEFRATITLDPTYSVAYNNLGIALSDHGRIDDAIGEFRSAVRLNPRYAEAHNNLGNALKDRGEWELAEVALRAAIELRADYSEAHYNLGNLLKLRRRPSAAIAEFRLALQCNPHFAFARNNLGITLLEEGSLEAAIVEFRATLDVKPDCVEAHNNLGNALKERGDMDLAIASYHAALRIDPNDFETLNNLGVALKVQGQLEAAVETFRFALRINPNCGEAQSNLGNALYDQGQADAALEAYRAALRINPGHVEALSNMGSVLRDKGMPEEAAEACRAALQLKPDLSEAHNNLGNALKEQGQIEEALEAYRTAVTLKPQSAATHGNLVYSMQFNSGCDARAIAEEQARWNDRHAKPLIPSRLPHFNTRDLDRRLKVGYVSPDFRSHAVSYFILPLLESHDRAKVEVYCYSGVGLPDKTTAVIRQCADEWRDVLALSDEALAAQIRTDGIDILVDLTLHTAKSRLLVFARKPAPVQVSWLAYPGSTGLETIDYRLTDAYMEPVLQDGDPAGERPARLPDSWCCYRAFEMFPDVSDLPAAGVGHVTFGSLNKFSRVNDAVLHCWCGVLRAAPGSRLLMLCPKGRSRDRVISYFDAQGVTGERVEFVAQDSWDTYIGHYRRIDIALDSFPCNGMTATCHALYMGAPVVTLPGETPASRAGLSLVSTIGLPELAAQSEGGYVRIATELASNLSRLSELRLAMRGRMQASPLMDAPRFAGNVEAAYREMWRRWCEATSGKKP